LRLAGTASGSAMAPDPSTAMLHASSAARHACA